MEDAQLLSKWAHNEYTYAGEDGMIKRLLTLIGLHSGFCVEFGADDGVTCSNTAWLRDRGWSALLVEADKLKFGKLRKVANPLVHCVWQTITPTGSNSIGALLGENEVDLMSIDIDGADYHIMEGLQVRPKVILVEYNQTIPWFLDVRAASPDNRVGASSLSLYRLAKKMGYEIVGATETNLFFLRDNLVKGISSSIVTDYKKIMEELPFRCGFVASNYTVDKIELNFENMVPWGPRSDQPMDRLVLGPGWYPGNSPAVSERAKRERVYYDR